MTLKPHQIGDQGQRYVLWTKDYPKPGWNKAAFGNIKVSMEECGQAMLEAPGCTNYKIEDRREVKV